MTLLTRRERAALRRAIDARSDQIVLLQTTLRQLGREQERDTKRLEADRAARGRVAVVR